ncbi:MAG: endonuclease/exonuclease/phosphatase family metal-dependent hydrolase [Myxococcota bacterium]|jgi:endonuclease/exonuclease/phosphatase family metal-dependent hydrolase
MMIRAFITLALIAAAHVGDFEKEALTVEVIPAPTSGTLSILTYNVAGLPGLVSQSRPKQNTPKIAPRLGNYDVAVVQEDFCYHAALDAGAPHAFRSVPEHFPGCTIFAGPNKDMGDGLNRFSHTATTAVERHDWTACNGTFSCGTDCMAPKGFTRAVHQVAPGVEVDIYNLHMDSGTCDGDITARQAQFAQLVSVIERDSAGRAVIVAGDTNFSADIPTDVETYRAGLRRAGLSDACEVTGCKVALLDRIMVRSSPTVRLTVSAWNVPSGFTDHRGRPLSDHAPVAANVRWSRTNPQVAAR